MRETLPAGRPEPLLGGPPDPPPAGQKPRLWTDTSLKPCILETHYDIDKYDQGRIVEAAQRRSGFMTPTNCLHGQRIKFLCVQGGHAFYSVFKLFELVEGVGPSLQSDSLRKINSLRLEPPGSL
jgi:hypothetical protein